MRAEDRRTISSWRLAVALPHSAISPIVRPQPMRLDDASIFSCIVLMTAWISLLNGRLADVAKTRSQIALSRPHYVYVLCRPDGTPFYVGKGVGTRCFHHEAEARTTERLTHKLNVILALKRRGEMIRYCIESAFDSEEEAHARERHLIGLFGRHDQRRGPLTNQTDGGEGASNPSEESRERRRQSLWAKQRMRNAE